MNILSILPLDRLANGFHLLGVPWKNVVHALKDTFKSCFVRNKRTLCNFLLEQAKKASSQLIAPGALIDPGTFVSLNLDIFARVLFSRNFAYAKSVCHLVI